MTDNLIYLYLATAISCFLQGITGFGFALILAPIASLFYDPIANIVFLSTISIVINLLFIISIDYSPDIKFLTKILSFSIIGAGLGVSIIHRIDPNFIKVFVYISSIIFSIILMVKNQNVYYLKKFESLVGMFVGFLQVTTGVSGPLLVLYKNTSDMPLQQKRKNMAIIFTFTSMVGLLLLEKKGSFTLDRMLVGLSVIPIVMFFGWLGHKVSTKVNQNHIKLLSFLIVLISSIVGLLNIART